MRVSRTGHRTLHSSSDKNCTFAEARLPNPPRWLIDERTPTYPVWLQVSPLAGRLDHAASYVIFVAERSKHNLSRQDFRSHSFDRVGVNQRSWGL